MSTLKDALSYNLAYPQLIVVRASAYNTFGWGDTSPINTVGATIKTEPTQMAIPARGSSTTLS